MITYQVSFFKDLLSSNGHPFRCLQDRVQICNADSPAQAAERAQKQFEMLHQIPIWNLRADSVDISEIRFQDADQDAA
jgi:hypothetical protein